MVKELVLEAVRKNELVECLEGKGNYKIEIGQWVNAYAPTDWTIIIPKGIYVVYRENPELQINKEFEGALLKMIGEILLIFLLLYLYSILNYLKKIEGCTILYR